MAKFIQNGVNKIRDLAYIPSRGLHISQSQTAAIWLEDPDFLRYDETFLPKNIFYVHGSTLKEESIDGCDAMNFNAVTVNDHAPSLEIN